MSEQLQEMFARAVDVMQKAYSPYSNYQVGVCIRSAGGQFYVGCNVENASYGLTLCAEGNAIGSMIANGDTKIRDIVIVSSGGEPVSPCGGCRQKIREFSDADTRIHCCDQQQIRSSQSINELLPDSFGPDNLK